MGPSLERNQTEEKPSTQGPFPRACPYYQVFFSVFDYLLEFIDTLKELLEAEFGNGPSLSLRVCTTCTCTHMHTLTHAHTHTCTAPWNKAEKETRCVWLSVKGRVST